MTTVHLCLDGDPAAVAAARELLEEALGELIHIGQVRPSARRPGTAFARGQLRVALLAERAVGELPDLVEEAS